MGSSFRLSPAIVVLGAAAASALFFAVSPQTRSVQAGCSASSPCPTPTPTPVNAFLTLDVTAGDSNTKITVTGSSFLPNEEITLYWDQPSNVAGSVMANSSGGFTAPVKPFASDKPGIHHLCASVPPNPCANFTLQAVPTPTPTPAASPSSSPSASASPTESPSPSPSSTPVAATISGLDVISKPPFVFLPIIGGLGVLVAIAFWAITLATRRRLPSLPSASVSHLASRPDYSAGFATPPPLPAEPAAPASAWAEAAPAPPVEEPPQAAAPEPAPQPEPPTDAPQWTPQPPPVDWPGAPDEPPDMPQPGD